jgi:hypothetical protein
MLEGYERWGKEGCPSFFYDERFGLTVSTCYGDGETEKEGERCY